ncbi:MAG: MFS transporter [Cellvibrionaceae bacterium]|nr:MFS transporter [Cellvibrionaceae bacterium]
MSTQVRAVVSLALLYSFRMLGLFMVLPVMILYGSDYGSASPILLGLALGIYGLTQSVFQIPLGLLSDIVGRKPVIIGGLIIFALGSGVAALSSTVFGLIIGRALQGCGAIASTLMAMVADLTSEKNRTKAMAVIGASIGLSFTLAMIIGPLLAAKGGLSAIFWSALILSVCGIGIVIGLIPTPKRMSQSQRESVAIPSLIRDTTKNTELMRLNFGVFSLHLILMCCFIVVPPMLEGTLNLDRSRHWTVYLPVLLLAFIFMFPLIMMAEKRKKIKSVMLGSIALLLASMALLTIAENSAYFLLLVVFIFFVAFNTLEASLPSLVSKLAPAGAKGTAMGLFATSQFLGAFFGGLLGGWLAQSYGSHVLLVFCSLLALAWLGIALFMENPRQLSSLFVPAEKRPAEDSVLSVPGVVEALWVHEESALYLKVDKDQFDNAKLEGILKNYA